MRYVFTIVCSKWCIRQEFTTDYKLSKFSVNVEVSLPEVYMSSKYSNNFSIIYLYCIILRNVNINLRFYIRYVNIWIVAFAWAYLYWEILTLTCVYTYGM